LAARGEEEATAEELRVEHERGGEVVARGCPWRWRRRSCAWNASAAWNASMVEREKSGMGVVLAYSTMT
jgi:hypothetical protein